jgi:hypothetical protein
MSDIPVASEKSMDRPSGRLAQAAQSIRQRCLKIFTSAAEMILPSNSFVLVRIRQAAETDHDRDYKAASSAFNMLTPEEKFGISDASAQEAKRVVAAEAAAKAEAAERAEAMASAPTKVAPVGGSTRLKDKVSEKDGPQGPDPTKGGGKNVKQMTWR